MRLAMVSGREEKRYLHEVGVGRAEPMRTRPETGGRGTGATGAHRVSQGLRAWASEVGREGGARAWRGTVMGMGTAGDPEVQITAGEGTGARRCIHCSLSLARFMHEPRRRLV